MAHRVSELQAISSKISFKKGDVILTYLEEFVAKTESVSNPLPREFVIRSLSDFVCKDDEERLLCPVRALKFYFKRTRALELRPRNLFLSPRDTTRPLSKNGLSYLLRETIVRAHSSLEERHYGPLKVKAHSIRAVATSFNFWKNRSLQDVLNAATWRTASVFAKFYLRDVERFSPMDMLFSLGPIVAAGDVLETK